MSESLPETIRDAWGQMLRQQRAAMSPHDWIYASQYRPCLRNMVYDLISPEMGAEFSVDTLANFQRGNDRERDLLLALNRVGQYHEPQFRIVAEQERFELYGNSGPTKGVKIIAGKIDARLQLTGTAYSGPGMPLEIKAWSPNLVAKIRAFADLLDNRWTEAGARQLLCYLLGHNEPKGYLILDRPGIPLFIEVILDDWLDLAEGFLQQAERAVQYRLKGKLPDFYDDLAVCKKCVYFGGVCNPPIRHEGVKIITDETVLQKLERREELKDQAKEFEVLDKEIKTELRGIENAIAGDFTLKGTWGKYSRLELPPEVKQQYTVVDPKGRFTLKISKL